MIDLVLTALLVAPLPVQEDAGEPAPADAEATALDLDPRDLPVAEEGRWSELFDGREIVPTELPSELATLAVRAREAYGRNAYAEAIELHHEILTREPDFPPSLLELGTTYFRLRRYGDTVECLERFLRVVPDQVFRTQVLGHGYYSLGRYEDALAHYRRVIEVLPGSPEAVRGLALAHYRLGQPEQALERLDEVIALRPDHAEAWVWKAQILHEEERPEEALVAVETARDLDRFSPKPWYLLSRVLDDLGRTAEADAARDEWRELDRLTQEARALEGQLLYRPGEFPLAMRLVEVQKEIGDPMGVRRALALAIRARPEDVSEVELRIYALDLLVELEDEEGAALAAEELARACADEAQAWKRLRIYYARTRQHDKHIVAGERYRRLGGDED